MKKKEVMFRMEKLNKEEEKKIKKNRHCQSMLIMCFCVLCLCKRFS